jgi:hypothetical protein
MIPYLTDHQRVAIEDILESAVVLSWQELVKDSGPGLVHVQYSTAPEPSQQYLKIWLSARRGTWALICEYWISAGAMGRPAMGLTFYNGYHSAALAKMLQDMMRPCDGFPNSLASDTHMNLIQVNVPTAKDRQKAKTCITDAYQRIGLADPQSAESAA